MKRLKMIISKLYIALVIILLPLNYALGANSVSVKVSCTIPRRIQIKNTDEAEEKAVSGKTQDTSRIVKDGKEIILKTAVAK
ncbi:MAG: hypothetical protein GF375_00660 [Candidatus Omnitrophica bacterium]|nr:hypothetical protein [Candidatus Omnitrophota bacterium]MBD3268670.1 hypothetical protein [Candidatus Omnitrophota bacterium]